MVRGKGRVGPLSAWPARRRFAARRVSVVRSEQKDRQRLNQLPATDPAAQPLPYDPYDEISLVDVARVVWRHRRAALATLLVVIVAAVAVALLTPKKYRYSTTIELGSRIEDGRSVPIEAPETALAKLEESYVPQERHRYLEAHPGVDETFAIEARAPKGSQLVVLESTARAEDGPAYRQIQERAVQALVADHARVFEDQRREVALEKKGGERDLQTLVDQESVLKARIERLKGMAQLLEQQIADTRGLIEDATANRSRAVAEARDEARAMTLLMLDNEVRESREHLAELQKQLQIGLADERDTLQSALQENQRDQVLQQAEVQRLDQQLQNLKQTRAVVLGMKSLKPVGISRSLIVVLGVLLGGLLALLVPLVLEFTDRVQRTLHGVSARRADDVGAVTTAD